MKITKLSALILFVGLAKNGLAQEASSVKLSNEYPEAGKTVTVTYTPGDGLLKGKTGLVARAYFMDNDNPSSEVKLKQDGKLWTAGLTVPDSAKAFIIKIKTFDNAVVDSNDGKGFIYLIYKDKKPIREAYMRKAYIYTFSDDLKINPNNDEAIADFKKEFELYPESKKEHTGELYSLMLRSGPAYKAEVEEKVNGFKSSENEADYSAVITALRNLHKQAQYDSLRAIAEAKFPHGEMVRSDISMAAYRETDLNKKDSLYSEFVKISPQHDYMNDYIVMQLAVAHLKENQYDKYQFYKRQLKDTTDLGNTLNGLAYDMAKKQQDLPLAEKLSEESVRSLRYKLDNLTPGSFQTVDEIRPAAQSNLDYAAETYNFVLYKEGKYTEAEKLQKPIFEKYPNDADIANDYAMMLLALKQYDKANNVIVADMKRGKISDDLKITLKKIYIAKNGSDKGYEAYIAPIDKLAKQGVLDALAKTMINDPAPMFTLKDLDGNVVSLASLKGKTVIVDFWATWCGPCKASMPGMQLAVTKYKDDPNVKFLFIDTWENGDNFVPGVKKFIGDNKYTFHVLLDEKDSTGAQTKVVSAFKVTGIPTKFIIDKKGNIRFKYVGFDGTADQLVAEVSNMITLAD